MAMGEFVSENNSIAENPTESEIKEPVICISRVNNLCCQFNRLCKNFFTFLKQKFNKDFINILYITAEEPPTDYILSLQKQYPDKIITVLIPLLEITDNSEKLPIKISYFMQNKKNNADVYRLPVGSDNINVYGIYTDIFSNIQNDSDIYNIKYLSHFTKIARHTALNLKPDIIHVNNVPFFMGLELESARKYKCSAKYIQTIHNFNMYQDVEPFWAAINFADKKALDKICSDNCIKNCLSGIFNIKHDLNLKKTKTYINYIYEKYEEYRQNVDTGEQTKENIMLVRMNERILKLFPKMEAQNISEYNPMYYSLKSADINVIHSPSVNTPDWAKALDFQSLVLKKISHQNNPIHKTFDTINFKDNRNYNKRFLLHECSEKRIEMRLYDESLFSGNEVNLRGHLDFLYSAPLLFIKLNEYTSLQDIKTVSLAVLQAFEQRKNIQIIYNFPKNLNNKYLASLLEFFESQQALNGKWLAVEGNLNLPQFLSASDMILIPSGNCLNVEQTFYEALKYGCIPVVTNDGAPGKIIAEIYGNISYNSESNKIGDIAQIDENFENMLFKMMDFYQNNRLGWNTVIKNVMDYNSNWDFITIENYNRLYEKI